MASLPWSDKWDLELIVYSFGTQMAEYPLKKKQVNKINKSQKTKRNKMVRNIYEVCIPRLCQSLKLPFYGIGRLLALPGGIVVP